MVTRPNYLALQAWGIRPKSQRRRRRALLTYLGPTFAYLAIVPLAWLLFITSHVSKPFLDSGPDHSFYMFFWLLIASWAFGFFFCLILPFRVENRFSNARVLHANLHDYRLAGLSGVEILNGLAAPQLAAARLFIKIYAAVLVVELLACSAFFINAVFFSLPLVLSWGASYFNLVQGTRLNVALWATTPSRSARILKIGTLIFTCPITLCTLVPPIILAAVFLFPITVASFPVRAVKVEDVWNAARENLDGNHIPLYVPIDAPAETTPEPDPVLRNTP